MSSPLPKVRDGLLGIVLVTAAVLHGLRMEGYHFEDAFITFRYARNVADGLGFSFNPGERVLGTSTPLFTLLLAALAWAGLDVPTAGVWIYCSSLSLAGFLGAWLLRRHGYANAGVFFALTTAWALGHALAYLGMETTLHLALIFACLLAADAERPATAGALLGLLCLNRYDGAVVAFAVGMFLWWRRRRPPWTEAFTALALFGSWLLFAQVYFGSIFPNTLWAKAGDAEFLPYLQNVFYVGGRQLFSPLGEMSIHASWPVRRGILILLFLPSILCLRLIFSAPRRSLLVLPAFALLMSVGYAVIGPPREHQWYHLPSLYGALAWACAGWGVAAGFLETRWLRGARAVRTLATSAATLAVLATLLSLPRAVEARVGSYLSSGVQQKIEAYDRFIDYIRTAGLEGGSILTYEPGYLTFHTGQRAIDAAGLITRDVYFHGPSGRQSRWFSLVEEFEPDLAVLPLIEARPRADMRAAFVPVSTAAAQLWLLLHRRAFEENFERLYDRWLEGAAAAPPGARTPEEQALDINEDWRLQGEPLESREG
ncbi:MAG: hypothetical protein AAF725_23635, partial [Acidobacteriota bacterium]